MKIKTVNIKMTTNSQLSTTEPKKQNKHKVSKQLGQEQYHRNEDHMEGYHWGGWEGENEGIGTRNKMHKL